jgi:hypothetical protein
MTKNKWSYVARGHYSTPGTGGGTIHVLRDGTVYKTHPSRETVDITGAKADRYIESAQTKFPVRGERRAEPKREPNETKPRTATTKPKKKGKIAKARTAIKKAKVGAKVKAAAGMVGRAMDVGERLTARFDPAAATGPGISNLPGQTPQRARGGKVKQLARRKEPTLEEWMGW